MQNHKIKYVCRLENGVFRQELYLNQILQDSVPEIPELNSALQFLNAFSPEELLKTLLAREENAVLVFRTDSQQMQTFSEILHQNFTESA